MFRFFRPAISAGLVASLLGACGGGTVGGGGGGPVPGVGTVAWIYPAFDGLTDAAVFTVRGTSTSADGITAVTVGGVPATSGDGFATWVATVPLALGPNVLGLSATTGAGTDLAGPSRTVTRAGVVAGELSSIDRDPATGTIWAFEPYASRLVEFGPSGDRVVTSPNVGSGTAPFNHHGLAVDVGAGIAYSVQPNSGSSVVDAVVLATGARSTVSGAGIGSGVPFQNLTDGAFDAVEQLYYAMDYAAGTVVAVDVATGARTTVSGAGVGAGPTLPTGNVYRLEGDFGAARVYVLGNFTLYAVSLPTGDRTIVSSGAVGAGPVFGANALALDPAGDRAFVGGGLQSLSIVAIDLASGDRTLVPAPSAPLGGPESSDPSDLIHDAANNRLIVSDGGRASLLAVDLSTGVRTRLHDVRRGSGPELAEPLDVGLGDDGFAYLLDRRTESALLRVELATGDRTLVAGSGPSFSSPEAMTIDLVGGRALVANATGAGRELLGVDLVTGNRAVVSAAAAPGSPALAEVRDLDTDGVTAWCTTATGALLSADLATGARAIIADGVTGAGPVILFAFGLVGVPSQGIVYVSGGHVADQGLFSVSLATGNRTPISTGAVGGGLPAVLAYSLAREASGSLVGATTFASTTAPLSRIDPLTGTRTSIVSGTTGPALEGANSAQLLARPRADGLLVVADDPTNTVLLVDPVTGERLVVAR